MDGGGEKTKPIQVCPFNLLSGQALSNVEWSQFQEFAPMPGRIGMKKTDLYKGRAC